MMWLLIVLGCARTGGETQRAAAPPRADPTATAVSAAAPLPRPTDDWPFKKKAPTPTPAEASAVARRWLEVSGTPFTPDEFAKAAGACDVEKVKLFVAAGIGLAERQKALDYRLSVGTKDTRCDEIVSVLATSGVKLDGEHLLQAAASGQRGHVSTVLSAGVDPNYVTLDGSTAAITAARVKSMSVMELLRDRGADLNLADKRGTTPLMVATDLGDVEMVRFLLATPRLEVNRRDGAGSTALHAARLSRSARRLPQVRWDEMIALLEKAGGTE